MKHIARVSFVVAVLGVGSFPAAGAEATGKEVFDHYCTYCHGTEEGPGSMQLGRTRGKSQALLTQRTNLTADYVRYVVRHGRRSMPAFVPSDLTDEKLKALVEFLAK